jgi:uncharacterized protein (DUF2141 family)
MLKAGAYGATVVTALAIVMVARPHHASAETVKTYLSIAPEAVQMIRTARGSACVLIFNDNVGWQVGAIRWTTRATAVIASNYKWEFGPEGMLQRP